MKHLSVVTLFLLVAGVASAREAETTQWESLPLLGLTKYFSFGI